ncbi:MAG: CRISPR system precrRNA processing endoribonuclease RAMP protein Cas6 [Acidobacteria bacterium]|nr:CRISPR system precrRNA processing endoribonuclease RAMP protein Cas6 [Acidobacteriota bacterium]
MAALAFCDPRCLALQPLFVEIEALERVQLPDYAGAFFRGGFGNQLRRAACSTGAPSCAGCPATVSCAYAQIFDTPVAPSATVLRKYPHAPRPFTLAPPLEGALEPGQRAYLRLTLIGPAVAWLPHFIPPLERMGLDRRAGRFRLRRVYNEAGDAVFDATVRELVEPLPRWTPQPLPAPPDALLLRFETPLRLRTNGRPNLEPTLLDVLQALFRRLHLLRALYQGFAEGPGWRTPLLQQAERAASRAHWRRFDWSRYSHRQERCIDMEGVIGEIEVRGDDLAALATWLRFAEPLHVGSSTSSGLGRYSLWVR